MEQIKENNLILVSKTEGVSKRLIPLSMEFNVVNNNSLFKTIMKESNILDYIERKVHSTLEIDFEGYTEEYKNKLRQENKRFKELLGSSTPKITIKIELEKYE
jgi:predicted metal-dependent hydrolase